MNDQLREHDGPSGQAARDVVIVGAGLAGLAAAITVRQRDPSLSVTVLEASSRAGGVLETIHEPPYLIERSADNFATLIPDAFDLCKATDYTSELISPEQNGRQAFVLHRGQVRLIPVGFSLVQPTRVWPVLTTRTLSWSGKLRMLAEYFVRSRADESDESLQSFAVRRLGREAFENLVEPIVSGIFTADPAKLSMQATLPQFVKMEREHGGLIRGHRAARRNGAAAMARRASGARYDQFTAPRHGMSHWIAHLVQSLPPGTIQFNRPVLGVDRLPSDSRPTSTGCKWRVQTAQGDIEASGLIVALPTPHAATMLRGCLPPIADQLGAIQYASSAVVVLAVDRNEVNRRVDGFGLIVPSKERRPVLAISYTSNKYAGRAPDNQLLLRIFLGGAMRPDILGLSDSELITVAQQQLREILDWRGHRCHWEGVVRWPDAMPQYHIGHTQRVAELMRQVRDAGTLRLCGAGYSGVGIPQTIRSARLAAEEIVHCFQNQNTHTARP